MEQKILSGKKQIVFFFVLCFLTYYSTYLGRLNYAASLAEIIRTEGISKGQAGLIGTAFFCAYGVGQLFAGFLGDKWNCKWLVFAGLAISGVMNGAMGLTRGTGGMIWIWCMNGAAQALIWSPLLRTICDLLDAEMRSKFCMYINYSVPLGTVSSYGLTAALLRGGGWRQAFFVPAIFVTAMAFFWLYGMKRLGYEEASRKAEQKSGQGIYAGGGGGKESIPKAEGMFWQSGLLLLLAALCVQGALKDGVTTWIPTYLQENYEIGAIASVLSTMVIPLCNLAGVFLASFAERKTGGNEIRSASFFFGICAGTFAVLLLSGEKSAGLALGMLAAATTSMMAVNSLLISVLPSRFGRLGRASGISGILNSCVYAGCAASTYGIGAVSESRGWSFTILLWVAGALAAFGICRSVSGRFFRYAKRMGL